MFGIHGRNGNTGKGDLIPDVSSTKGREVSGAIMLRMIEAISGEKPKRDIIARSIQLKRLLVTPTAEKEKSFFAKSFKSEKE